MKRTIATALAALAAACTPAAPAASGPEAVVEKIYQTLVDSKGDKTTPLADIPMTDDLKALVDRAEAAGQSRNEPVFDGDFAGNCQDCSGFSGLKVAGKADAGLAAGHQAVEATFKLYADVPRTVTWDMVESAGGWRVDNIVSDGIDLRKVAQESIDAPAAPGADSGGAMGMTAMDPGGFTEEGFTFHTRPGSKHVVRLQAPGTDTWRAVASGEPTVKQVGSRKETTPEGKAALVFEYEALQSGNVAIEFERLEDGEVEAKRTINFMVH